MWRQIREPSLSGTGLRVCIVSFEVAAHLDYAMHINLDAIHFLM